MSAESILPLIQPEPSKSETLASVRSPIPGPEPEQVAAASAAVIAGVSESTWWWLHAATKVPRPDKLGGRTLWEINGPNGLREWIRQRCPSRSEFEARQEMRS
jgi:predicted DNA-binding transcriptional regulator AlpA